MEFHLILSYSSLWGMKSGEKQATESPSSLQTPQNKSNHSPQARKEQETRMWGVTPSPILGP